MSSSNNSRSKGSRGARISVRPVWRRKVANCNNPKNDVIHNQPHPNDPYYYPSPFNPSSSQPPHQNIHQSHPSNMDPMLHVQTNIPNYNPTPPPSPSSEHNKFVEELKEAHELSALLAMHLAQRNLDKPPSSPYSNCHPHTLNSEQVEHHTSYCPCCIYIHKQTIFLEEHLTWIEHLLTKKLQSPQQEANPSSTIPTPPTPSSPPKSPSNNPQSTQTFLH